MNVELDEPLARRRAAIERLTEVHGTLRADDTETPESHSPAHLAWWLSGERGRVRAAILMSPERPSRVQGLTLTSVPEPPAGLTAIAARLVAVLGEPAPSWPETVPLASGADRPAMERSLRAAAARFGPVTLGPATAGDGEKVATWRLTGERGSLSLELELDEPGGTVLKAGFVPQALETAFEPD
jgi:hypothetical protein